MERLAKECLVVNNIEKIEFSQSLISWIEEDLKDRYTTRLKGVVGNQRAEKVFYNIFFCVVERLRMWTKGESRDRIISYSKFCDLIGWNRKTLSRKVTVIYTIETIKKYWITEDTDTFPQRNSFRIAIIDFFNEVAEKINGKK